MHTRIALLSPLLFIACGPIEPRGVGGGAGGGASSEPTCTEVCDRIETLCGSQPPDCTGGCGRMTQAQRACVASSASCTIADGCLQTGSGGGSGAGGGTASGGGGGGGGGGSTKTTNVMVSGSFAGKVSGPTSVLSMDMKTLYTNINAEAKSVTFSPTLSDSLDLMKAATMNITRPLLGACKNRPTVTSSTFSRNVIVGFTGTDPLPSTACKDWADAVKQSGFSADFTEVPYANGGKAVTVKVDLGP